MFRTITTILVIAGGIMFTGLVNIRLPQEWMNMITEIVFPLYAFDGLVPVTAFFNGLWTVLNVLFYFFLFKYIIGMVSLLLGGGKPDIE